MTQKAIFSNIQSETDRNTVLSNIRKITSLIPSIKTLFENLKYLEPCSNILKDLAKYEWKQAESLVQAESLEQCFYRCYICPERLKVYGLNGYSTCVAPSKNTAFRLAYVQLWLFCLANFPRLTSSTCRKEPGKPKPKTTGPNPRMLHELGERTTDLGFQLQEAKRLKESDPYCEIARRSILTAHPEIIKPTPSSINNIAQTIKFEGTAEIQGKAATLPPKPVSIGRRVGVPFNNDFEADRVLLCLENIAIRPETCSTLFVRRDLVLSFFGNDIFSVS
jgi:Protein of unknown function (DUF3723)